MAQRGLGVEVEASGVASRGVWAAVPLPRDAPPHRPPPARTIATITALLILLVPGRRRGRRPRRGRRRVGRGGAARRDGRAGARGGQGAQHGAREGAGSAVWDSAALLARRGAASLPFPGAPAAARRPPAAPPRARSMRPARLALALTVAAAAGVVAAGAPALFARAPAPAGSDRLASVRLTREGRDGGGWRAGPPRARARGVPTLCPSFSLPRRSTRRPAAPCSAGGR